MTEDPYTYIRSHAQELARATRALQARRAFEALVGTEAYRAFCRDEIADDDVRRWGFDPDTVRAALRGEA